MKKTSIALLSALWFSGLCQAADFVTLQFGNKTIKAEVAISAAERQKGLMFRTSMAKGHGMLFIMDGEESACMWMKNTKIPLSVAFIDAFGKIINIEDMEPETTDIHCSRAPAKYALEMNKGWFGALDPAKQYEVKGLPLKSVLTY